MTIHPPKVVIDEKEPFKDALFGREEFGKSLVSVLRNVSDNLVIFVNAPWGEGKTTFSQMWLAHLRLQQKLEVIYYNAYAADYFDDPFVSFSGEILALVDKRLADGRGLVERKEFKRTAVEVGKRLAGLTAKIGIRAATLGAVESAQLNELKDIASEIATGVSEIGGDIIEKKIEGYSKEKESLIAFKESLAKLASKVREEQGFPLTIIVDELDRCRPDFALGLLERIKHLFDVEGVAFVMLVNREQIENYIRAVYGCEVDSHAYLQKFGSLFVDLPSQQASFSRQYVPGRKEYCDRLFMHYGLLERGINRNEIVTCMGGFANHFDLTLREIERAFAAMSVYYSSTPPDQMSFPVLVALLSTLKVKRPALYQSLRRNKLSAQQFLEQSTLKQMQLDRDEAHNLSEWVVDVADYCLMSEEEYERATNETNGQENVRGGLKDMKRWSRGNRNKMIPSQCWLLDRFSLQPE